MKTVETERIRLGSITLIITREQSYREKCENQKDRRRKIGIGDKLDTNEVEGWELTLDLLQRHFEINFEQHFLFFNSVSDFSGYHKGSKYGFVYLISSPSSPPFGLS